MLNNQTSIWEDLQWNDSLKYKDVEFDQEMQNNVFNFEVASTDFLFTLFDMYEAESKRVIETPVRWDDERGILEVTEPEVASDGAALVFPAFDLALKCSHIFNLLDARGAVSVTERAAYINRVRARARACCLRYVERYKAVEA